MASAAEINMRRVAWRASLEKYQQRRDSAPPISCSLPYRPGARALPMEDIFSSAPYRFITRRHSSESTGALHLLENPVKREQLQWHGRVRRIMPRHSNSFGSSFGSRGKPTTLIYGSSMAAIGGSMYGSFRTLRITRSSSELSTLCAGQLLSPRRRRRSACVRCRCPQRNMPATFVGCIWRRCPPCLLLLFPFALIADLARCCLYGCCCCCACTKSLSSSNASLGDAVTP